MISAFGVRHGKPQGDLRDSGRHLARSPIRARVKNQFVSCLHVNMF